MGDFKNLKTLVENFMKYTTTISTTEEELFDNIGQNRNDLKTREDFLKVAKQEILYDFIFNIDNIKKQINNDLESYVENSIEYEDIQKIIKEIKSIFTDFEI